MCKAGVERSSDVRRCIFCRRREIFRPLGSQAADKRFDTEIQHMIRR
jgi:hypothetical protein